MILRTERTADIAGILIRPIYILFHIIIDLRHWPVLVISRYAVQNLCCSLEEGIIEVYDAGKASEVGVKRPLAVIREFRRHCLTKKFPIGSPPSVDALLYIPDYQIITASGLAFSEKRAEILPLDTGCILKLVQQIMVVAYTYLLIDKRCIRFVNYAAKNSI